VNIHAYHCVLVTTSLSYPALRSKPSTHSMCAQESSLHTYRTENEYRITNIAIYRIYYEIMSLQKTKSNTLGSLVAKRYHNSTGNRPVAIARLELHIEELQCLLQLLSSRFEWQGKITRLSTLMVGTQQV
jgi:hypothetical protein